MPYDPTASRSGAIASDSPSYRGAWLCYINGIEVPCVGFTASTGVWKIPEFQIFLLPDIQLEDLGAEDKVPVAIFYLDQWVDVTHPEWRLLIDGEIVGRSMVHVSNQRLLSFTCLSNIQIFQQLYFFFMNTVDDIVAANSPDVQAQGITSAGLFYPYSLFHKGLFAPAHVGQETGTGTRRTTNVQGQDDAATDSDDPIQAPYELVYNIIKGLISTEVTDDHRSLPMMNFFARHARKSRLYNRFVRLPQFEDIAAVANHVGVFPIFDAARNDLALGAMQRQMAGEISNSGPVWNILEQVLGTVFMEIGMIGNPACVITNLDGEIQRLLDAGVATVDQNAHTSADANAAANAAAQMAATQAEVEAVEAAPNAPTAAMAPPTAIDVFNAVLAAALPFANATTSVNLNAEFQSLNRFQPAVTPQTAKNISLRNIANILGPSSPAIAAGGTAADNLINMTGSVPQQSPAQTAPAATTATTGTGSPNPTATSSMGSPVTTPARLAQYFVKPQFMFGVAPMCNVFFPSMVSQWTDDESFANQPTRIYVNDSVMTRLMRAQGANRDQMLHALSVAYPEEADAVLRVHEDETDTNRPGAGNPHGTGKDLLIWPEEFYKGPVTAHMSLPSWFQMLMQARNSGTGDDATAAGPAVLTAPTAAGNAQTGPSNPSTTTTPATAPTTSVSGATTATAPSTASTNSRTAGAPAGTSADHTDPGVVTSTPQLPVVVSRGRVNTGPPFYWDAWNPPDSSRQIARGIGGISDRKDLTAGELRALVQSNPSWVGANGNITIKYPGLDEFRRRMISMFPGLFDDGGRHVISASALTALPDSSNAASAGGGYDPHKTGRAVDLGVRMQGHRANHAVGDPVANYLIEHAREIGLWYVIWADAIYVFRPQWGVGFRPYTANALSHGDQTSPTNLHRDHLHVQLTFPAAMQQTSWFANSRPPPARTATASHATTPPAVAPPTSVHSTLPGPTPRAPNLRVVTRPATSTPSYTTVGGDTPNDDQSFQRLFRIYAQYEFFRQRYMQRRMGIESIFNPYVIPGFPCVMLDRVQTQSHRVGYVMEVRHSAMAGSDGQGSWNTSVTASCARRYREFLRDIRNDCERFSENVASAPAEIVPTIRQIIQDEGNAEKFYQLFLYGGTRPGSAPAAFHYQEVLGFSVGSSATDFVPITVTGEGPSDAAATRTAADAAAATATTTAAANPNAPTAAMAPPTAIDVFNAVLAAALPFANATTSVNLNAEFQSLNRFQPAVTPQTAKNISLRNIANILGPSSPAIAAGGTAADNLINMTGSVPQQSPAQTAPAATTATTGTGTTSPSQNTALSQASAPGFLTVTHNLTDLNLPLAVVPGSPYMDAMDQPDTALQLCSRPACTLEQYIRFWHGGKTLGQCILDGNVQGDNTEFSYQRVTTTDVNGQDVRGNPQVGLTSRATATFYTRIYQLRIGPGTPPTDNQRGYSGNPPEPTGIHDGMPSAYPQTRADWDSILLNYRYKVRTQVTPGL